MSKYRRWLGPLTVALALTAQGSGAALLRSEKIALTPDGLYLVVVGSESNSIAVVDIASRQKLAQIPVGRSPRTVSLDASGSTAYVTNLLDDTLTVVDLQSRAALKTVAVCDEPFGVVAVPAGLIYVSCHGASAVEVFDSATVTRVDRIPTAPRPRGLLLAADGSELYVTHFHSGRLSVVDLAGGEVSAMISTGLDTGLSQGIAADASGTRLYLPQTRFNVSNPYLTFDSTVFPVVSVVHLPTRQHLPSERIHLDTADRPVNLPLDVAVAASGVVYVLNAGSNDLSVIDLSTGQATAHLELGHNPRGLMLSPSGDTLFVNNSLSGTVSVVDLSSATIEEINVTDPQVPPPLLAGKRLFNSADLPELTRDQWISCATCHFDGEPDGRTWLLTKGQRNVPSLLGVGQTLPANWSGDLDELQDVESSIRGLQAGTGLVDGPDNCDPACDQGPPNAGRSEALDNLAAYLGSLRPHQSPNTGPGGRLTADAARGKILFWSTELQCLACHPPPLYTDRARYDVGTANSPVENEGPAFDVPSLRGLYNAAPYLHDGRAATLSEVLTVHNPDNRHGTTAQLSANELQSLIAYLQSLPENSVLFADGFEFGI